MPVLDEGVGCEHRRAWLHLSDGERRAIWGLLGRHVELRFTCLELAQPAHDLGQRRRGARRL